MTAGFGGELDKRVDIVNAHQRGGGHFAHAVRVADVGPRVMRAGVARAAVHQWGEILFVLGVADNPASRGCKEGAVPCYARGQHAIEQVDAVPDAFQQILGRADAHQVTRFVPRQLRRGVRNHPTHLHFGFSHAHPADGEAVRRKIRDEGDAFIPQILIDAALYNGKQRLIVRSRVMLKAGVQPAVGRFQ